MEGTNRFKALDLIDRVPEELWTEVHGIVQEAVIKTSAKKKKYKIDIKLKTASGDKEGHYVMIKGQFNR